MRIQDWPAGMVLINSPVAAFQSLIASIRMSRGDDLAIRAVSDSENHSLVPG